MKIRNRYLTADKNTTSVASKENKLWIIGSYIFLEPVVMVK